jgi:hypothetical protein
MLQAIAGMSAAFGLASSAGLNAYIPLLIVALAARFPLETPLLRLSAPYDILGSWWAIGLLAALLAVEVLVDKIPAVDTVNDLIQTFVRPAAGAVLFAANAEVITDIHPALALGAGLLVAGGVHVAKGTVRPAITATTAGTGNWLVSTLEDIAAIFMSILAVVLPIVAGLAFIGLATLLFVLYRRRRRRKQQRLVV